LDSLNIFNMRALLMQSYETDVIAWTNEQAAFIRSGRSDLLDIEHIADEIEDVGKSEKRELKNRMVVLLAHLLRWQYQTGFQGNSWVSVQFPAPARERGHLCPPPGGMAILGSGMDEPRFPQSLKTDRSPKRHEVARGVLRPSPFAAQEGRDPRARARMPALPGGKRLHSWRRTIKEQRRGIAGCLKGSRVSSHNPTLLSLLVTGQDH
jgi:hypothetical protein